MRAIWAPYLHMHRFSARLVAICLVAVICNLGVTEASPAVPDSHNRQNSIDTNPTNRPNTDYVVPLTFAGPSGTAMKDLLAALTQGNTSAACTSLVRACLYQFVDPKNEAFTDTQPRAAHKTDEEYIVDMIVARHPLLIDALPCMLDAGVVHPKIINEVGPHLLFSAVAHFGALPEPFSVIDALLRARTPLNFTLGSVFKRPEDEFGVLHKAVDHHKIILLNLAGRLLRKAEQNPEWYSNFLMSVVKVLSPFLTGERKGKLRAAVERMGLYGVSSRNEAGNHTVYRSDLETLEDMMSFVLTEHIVPLIAAYPSDPVTGMRPLHTLMLQQDKFDRSPLHIAVLSSPSAVSTLLRILLPTTPGAPPPALALQILETKDVFGYTPQALAEAFRHPATASTIARAVELVRKALPAGLQSQDSRAVSVERTRPKSTSASASKPLSQAVASAAAASWPNPISPSKLMDRVLQVYKRQRRSNKVCDFDVINIETDDDLQKLNQNFVYEYLIPNRPVLIRGVGNANPLKELWTFESLLSRHANVSMEVADIPYATSFGMSRVDLTLAEYSFGLLYCEPHGTFNLPDDAVTLLHKLHLNELATDRTLQRSICDAFIKRQADGSSEFVYRYIFETLRKPHQAAILKDFGETLLPPFLNGTMPMRTSSQSSEINVGYAGDLSLTESRAFPVSAEDVVLRDPVVPYPQFYVGPAGTGAPMHYHNDAVNVLVFGSKQWYIYPPGQGEYSTLPIAQYVTEVLPTLTASRRPLQCQQHAGDFIFVPKNWAHAVLNTATTVGYAFEFGTPLQRY